MAAGSGKVVVIIMGMGGLDVAEYLGRCSVRIELCGKPFLVQFLRTSVFCIVVITHLVSIRNTYSLARRKII